VDLSWVDTHAHLGRYEPAERTALLERAREAGVAVITVATDLESSRIATTIPGVAGAVVGIHPRSAASADMTSLRELLTHPSVIAVGECGFDAKGPSFKLQAAVFEEQAALAREHSLTLVLHVDGPGAFDTVAQHARDLEGLTVVRHYFTGTADEAAWHTERGHYLSFGNPLRRDLALRDVAASYPADLLLIETDAYLLPDRLTEPRDVARIAESLALVRNWSIPETSARLIENTRAAFPRLLTHPW
jgi:TatD DNase family protein